MKNIGQPFCAEFPTQLADYPFKGVWLWFWGTLDPASIQAALNELVRRLNYNEGIKCIGNTNFFSKCYREDEVESVLLAYANLVEKGLCNEFTNVNPNSYNVIKTVSDALNYPYNRVQKILLNLLYGTNDGSIKGGQVILRPKTNSKKTGLEEIPQSIKDNSLLERLKTGAGDTIDTAGNILKWVVIGGCVVGSMYVIGLIKTVIPKNK